MQTICPQLYGFNYLIVFLRKWLNSFIWVIDGTLISTNTMGMSWPKNYGNEEIFHISQIELSDSLTSRHKITLDLLTCH